MGRNRTEELRAHHGRSGANGRRSLCATYQDSCGHGSAYAAGGLTETEIIAEYPDLQKEDIRECLRFVAAAAMERELPLLHPCLESAFGLQPAVDGTCEPDKRPVVDAASRGNYRILLVEDNLVNQEVAMGLLEYFGYNADVVSRGQAALKALRETEYTLVLTDCQMPEMDGYELARLIREPETGVLNPRIPIIALTAHSLSADREKCLSAGMDDFLTKPLKPELLDKTLSRWIGSAPAAMKPDLPPALAETISGGFDESDLVERMMGNENSAKRIARRFLNTMPEQLTALQEALAQSDAKTAVMVAHSIKGSAANVGGSGVRDLAYELEKSGESGILDAASESLPQLIASMESLANAIQEFCDRTA